jgi:hypothetical protein
MSQPAIHLDLTIVLRNGLELFEQVQVGRDEIALSDDRIRIERHPSPHEIEELLVTRADVVYIRTVRREIPPEVAHVDAHTKITT